MVTVSNTDNMVTCYQTNSKHRAAMERAINLFKQFYRPETIYMHSNGGSSQLRSLTRLYCIRNITSTRKIHSRSEQGMFFTSPEAGAAYLERLSRVARIALWVLLLEDYVWLHAAVLTPASS